VVPAEMSKVLGVKGKRELYDICNEIYISGEWPCDFGYGDNPKVLSARLC